MNLQAVLNELCLLKMPKVLRAIDSADSFDANQMKCHALRKVLNLAIPMEEHSELEIRAFEEELLDNFKYKHWMK